MAAYPYARIAHLTGLSLAPYMQAPYAHKSTTTPTTITGSPHGVMSYALTIGYTDNQGRGWWVHDQKNSRTTNRHIGALTAVLEANGYKPTDEIRHDRAGMGRVNVRRLWAKA
jgi:hypothetical protein